MHRNCSGLLTLKIQGFIHKSLLEGLFFHPCFPVVPILTSQPGHAVGFGRGSVNPEGFGGKSLLVLGFLHQVSDLSHEPVQEARQHCSAPDHHQVLCQLLPGVYGALMHTGTQKTPNKSNCLSLKPFKGLLESVHFSPHSCYFLIFSWKITNIMREMQGKCLEVQRWRLQAQNFLNNLFS